MQLSKLGAGKKIDILCTVGPSGVGKGTVLSHLFSHHPNRFAFAVSHTTRKARPGEVPGVSYHYAEMEEMKRAIERREFLEHALVHGNLYGTSFDSVSKIASSGKICVMDIDVQGLESIKTQLLKHEGQVNLRSVGFVPSSMEDLEARLRGRGTETEDEIRRRLDRAAHEMEKLKVPGFVDEVVVNRDSKVVGFPELARLTRQWKML